MNHMKKQILIGMAALLAGSTLAADLKDDVTAAAKKLADAGYSWKTTTGMGGDNANARFRPGPTEGKMAKDGLIQISMSFGTNTTEAFVKGDKGAVKTREGWQSLAELNQPASDQGGGAPGRGRMYGRMLQNYKAPGAEVVDLAGKLKGLKKEGDAIVGEMTEEGAKSMMMFGRRAGGNGPEISNAKGSAKFWLKDGALSKFEYNVKGTITFNNNDRDVDRTTTVEIKDVGTTKVEVPDEAKKKLS
jgi:hypothetical protein